MIKTERQLSMAEEKLRQVHAATKKAAEAGAGIQEESLQDFAADLQREITEYNEIRRGEVRTFQVDGFSDLAKALIKARMTCRLSQADLAERLGVAEQQVQRDEAGGYERASLTRLADVAEALGYHLTGNLEPATPREPLTEEELLIPPMGHSQ
ncbi:helix-turn-helix domain-containing protein [Streptomyces sp. NBC_00647]|uniref:helix-turn-helix domain-containing protein n=1 Tax=Streptomyces sp. NBC_00647 TaxID=2975796 RepID=UPI003255285E